MKNNDVYKFIKSPLKDNWCFDNQLVVKDGHLIDTYWAYINKDLNTNPEFKSDSSCKKWKIEDIDESNLEFMCNLDEVKTIHGSDLKYYKEEDIVNLGYQHRCYSLYALRDGSNRDKDTIIKDIEEAIISVEWTISSSKSKLLDLNELKDNVESDNIDLDKVYYYI